MPKIGTTPLMVDPYLLDLPLTNKKEKYHKHGNKTYSEFFFFMLRFS